jgi:hypothetical protein
MEITDALSKNDRLREWRELNNGPEYCPAARLISWGGFVLFLCFELVRPYRQPSVSKQEACNEHIVTILNSGPQPYFCQCHHQYRIICVREPSGSAERDRPAFMAKGVSGCPLHGLYALRLAPSEP